MLMCNGKGCNWRRVCSRYVIGQAARNLPKNDGDTVIDHCPNRQDKFIAINSDEGRRVAEKLNQGKETAV